MRKSKPDPIVEAELFNDEQLVWWGKPKPIHLIRLSDVMTAAFGLFFAAFAVFFISISTNMMGNSNLRSVGVMGANNFDMFRLLFTLMPLIFIGVGLWKAATPFRQFYTATQTTYALTDQRAIIITSGLSSGVRSFYKRDIDRVQRSNRADGTGDIIFGPEQVRRYRENSHGNYRRAYTVTIKHGFFGIQDARYVEDMIVQLFIQENAQREIQEEAGKPKYKPPHY